MISATRVSREQKGEASTESSLIHMRPVVRLRQSLHQGAPPAVVKQEPGEISRILDKVQKRPNDDRQRNQRINAK